MNTILKMIIGFFKRKRQGPKQRFPILLLLTLVMGVATTLFIIDYLQTSTVKAETVAPKAVPLVQLPSPALVAAVFVGTVILGVVAIIAIALARRKSSTPPPPTIGVPAPATATSGWNIPWRNVFQGIGLILMLAGIYLGWTAWTAPPKDTGLVVGRGWSQPIRIPSGQEVTWAPRDNVDFEVKVNPGRYEKIYPIVRVPEDDQDPCSHHVRVTEDVKSFQLRVVDKEIKETIFDLPFSPYRLGGPCNTPASKKASKPEPKPDVPQLFPRPAPFLRAGTKI